MGGFRYRGRSISDFGQVIYAPDEKERAQHILPYETFEEELDGRNGGYHMGSRIKSRNFQLKCYYENMTEKKWNEMLHWFSRKTQGE